MQPSLFTKKYDKPECQGNSAVKSDAGGGLHLYNKLNKAQYSAATTVNGPLLVVAGAGSGKTRTLVYRVVHLIEKGIAPENILLLTFTRKAAQEMVSRASFLLDESCHRVTGGTFHGVANLLLRRYGSSLGYASNFTILDRSDAEGIINILKSSLSLGGAGKRFPSKRVIINIISKSVNKGVAMEDLLADEYGHLYEFIDDLHALKEQYEIFKFEHGLMDYDDLLVNWHRLLSRERHIQEAISDRFTHIMVDEYQDTNPIQAEIIRLLACSHNNVMAVGDDSQSIYSFRGADFRNIMNFPRLFPDTKIVKLEENYRSTQPILTLANAIIDQAADKYTKVLHTSIEGDQKPQLFGAKDETAEAAFVARKIEELQGEGIALGNIAVLFRSGFHSFKLEMELSSRHIPFEKRGGLKLTEAAHIKDIISYFRVLVNPYDHLSWNRILLLLEKIGPKTAQKILQTVKSADDPLAALAAYPADKKWKTGFDALLEALQNLQKPDLQPVEQYDLLLEFYRPVFERLYYDDYPKRSKDLEQLKNILAEYDNLVAFVADTALDPPEIAEEVASSDMLVLSTVHSAKGLEWDTVFVINLAEGKFPHAYSLPGEQIEEERRLLYVAATRAKRRLYLTYPCETMTSDRKWVKTSLTPFLAEIAPNLYELISQKKHQPQMAVPYGSFESIPTRHKVHKRRKKSLAIEDLTIGAKVKHPFFGQGSVEAISGPRSIDVVFAKHGRKTLHLDYAKLELA